MFDKAKRFLYRKKRMPGGKKVVSYLIFGFMCLIFVFIGIPMNPLSSVGGAAIVVKGRRISWREYRDLVENLRSVSEGGASDPDAEVRRQNRIRRQAVGLLVERELLVQAARGSGLVVSDSEVGDHLVSLPVFQEDGRFQKSRYLSFLKSRRFSASYFEDLIRKEMEVLRFQSLFQKSQFVSRAEREKRGQLASFKVEVSYARLNLSGFDEAQKNSFKDLVQAGGGGLLNKMLREKDIKWEQTGSFDLTRLSLPGLHLHKSLLREVVKKLPDTGLVPRVIYSRGESFLLRLDRFHTSEPSSVPPGQDLLLEQMVSQIMFLNWMSFLKNQTEIRYHPQIASLFSDQDS